MWHVARGTALAFLATAVACSGGSGKTTTSTARAAQMSLSSPAFTDGGTIPRQFTCEGADQSPPLAWSGVPAGTTTLSLVVEDPDASNGTFVHWTVSGIPPSTASIAAGQVPAGASQGRNTRGATRYTGPCPPSGQTHHYLFTLKALAGSSVVGLGRLTCTYKLGG